MKDSILKSALSFACLIMFICIQAHAQNVPSMKVAKFDTSPKLDGNLNDACWKNCQTVDDFTFFGKEGKTKDTEVKIGFDNKWLYLGVKCQHPRPDKIRNKDGIRVILLGGSDMGKLKTETFKITKDWKRYNISGLIPAKAHRYSTVQLRVMDEGTVWADAIQVEKGSKPTEFEK